MIYSYSSLNHLCQVRYHLVNVTLVITIRNSCIFPWNRWRHIPSAETLIEWKLCAEKSVKSLEKKYFWECNVALYDLLVGLCFLQMICGYFRLLLPDAAFSDPLRSSKRSIQQQLYVKVLLGEKGKMLPFFFFFFCSYCYFLLNHLLSYFIFSSWQCWIGHIGCESPTQFLIFFVVKIVL